ncbi:MAG: putative quinol monooxygenase [Aliarcobacter sp.]|jgi:quinol monooxygenase YgiN|nr:putative quinol monooxygenase [Aliarcobacter sp.]
MAITRQIIFIAKRDCIEELKTLLSATIKDSKKEDGCLMYQVFQTKNNPVEFIAIDSWENEEALNKHYESEHYLHFLNSFKQYNAHIEPFELEIL